MTKSQEQRTNRPISAIAREIEERWPVPDYSAAPYLRAMKDLVGPDDVFGPGRERGSDIVRYFLLNAKTWRGVDAHRIKSELRRMIE